MSAPFITTTELGDKLGQSAADARGTAVVTAACDICRTLTGQDFTLGTTTVVMDGTGTDVLQLPERPVLNAGTVIESGGTLTFGTDYKLGDVGDTLYRLPGVIDNGWGTPEPRCYWWPGRQNISVTFEHGYATTPADLKEVALGIASRLYTQRTGVISSETLGSYSVRYESLPSELTTGEEAILYQYKRGK